MQRYLILLAMSFAGILMLVAGFTRVINPYGYWEGPSIEGLNRYKPSAGRHLEAVKLRQIVRVQPATIVAGNSRVGAGFDPRSQSWPADAHPVYNFGFPGVGTAELVDRLIEALDETRPRAVVFAVDFLDFRVSQSAWRAFAQEQAPERSRLRERVEILLSLDALTDSASAIPEQFKSNPAHTDELGYDSLAFYNDLVAAEGHAALFEQRQRENVAGYRTGPKAIQWPIPGGNRNWAALDRLAAECRRRGIELTVVTYPYHGSLLSAFQETGLWPAFEDWHRGLAAFSARSGVPVWDFSRVSFETVEPIPAPGDTKTHMRWYWEGGHFKASLGDLVISDLRTDTPQLGTRLGVHELERVLASKRSGLMAYAQVHLGQPRQRKGLSGQTPAQGRRTLAATDGRARPRGGLPPVKLRLQDR
jgi:hypothetical protein